MRLEYCGEYVMEMPALGAPGALTTETPVQTPRARSPDKTPPGAPTRSRSSETRSVFIESITELELYYTEVREQSRDAYGLWILLRAKVPIDTCLSILQSMYNKNPESRIELTLATFKEFKVQKKRVETVFPSFSGGCG